jgi:N-acyl-D-amino-acid deacylase
MKVFDVILKDGTIYDGSGRPPLRADIGIIEDRIIAIGNLALAPARRIVSVADLAVAPGFINMLSWSTESLLIDGRSQSEIRQGVTTQIFGEGESMGPLSDRMKNRLLSEQGDLRFEITWTTLAEYLTDLERKGISQNVASFIGASTIREHVIGLEDERPTSAQLDKMRELVRREMEDGALGIGSSLIYAPGVYATRMELIELCKVAAEFQGKYISHLRSEGNKLVEAVEELITISREASIPAEIYHLKAIGQQNWHKMDHVIGLIEAARSEGLKITADMYTYTAAATGLDAMMPPWALAGGYEALFYRLEQPDIRKEISEAIRIPTDDWENFFHAVSSPDQIVPVRFRSEALQTLAGQTLAYIAKTRHQEPIETIIDLMLEDRSRVGCIYFMMSEENIRKQLRMPWVSLGSDAASIAPEGVFLKRLTHPRAYGTFARLLGKYVRDEQVISLAEAIYRLSGLPADNLGLESRGFIREGMFADVVVFDPLMIADRATFANPSQYSIGVKHVFVNGIQVLKDGEHTGARPGRALWGPGKIIRRSR